MIRQPTNVKSNSLTLKWDRGFKGRRNAEFDRSQKIIDSETLRYSDPMTPRRSGNLIRSGIRSTKLGSGEVKYNTPYAKRVYKAKNFNFRGAPMRGSQWFERMKKRYKDIILRTAGREFK